MQFNHIKLLEQIITEQLIEPGSAVTLELWRGAPGNQKLQQSKSRLSEITKLSPIMGFTITAPHELTPQETVNVIKSSPAPNDINKKYIQDRPNIGKLRHTIVMFDWESVKRKWQCDGVILQGELELYLYLNKLEQQLEKFAYVYYKYGNIVFPAQIAKIKDDIKQAEANARLAVTDTSSQRVITPQSDADIIRELQRNIIAFFKRNPQNIEAAPDTWKQKIQDFIATGDTGKWETNMSEIVRLLNAHFTTDVPPANNEITQETHDYILRM
jgi:hypothetical protein